MLSANLAAKIDQLIDQYDRDGVVCIRDALEPDLLEEAFRCFQWSLNHPTPSACTFYDSDVAEFYQYLTERSAALLLNIKSFMDLDAPELSHLD